MNLSDDQMAELLRHARELADDVRDQYFRDVARELRALPDIDDQAVTQACKAAFRSLSDRAARR